MKINYSKGVSEPSKIYESKRVEFQLKENNKAIGSIEVSNEENKIEDIKPEIDNSDSIKYDELKSDDFKSSKADSINSEFTEGYLTISIVDTGIGISEAGINRLFKPFAQAEATVTRKFGGTGLGLWISKNIIELMGGDIKVP